MTPIRTIPAGERDLLTLLKRGDTCAFKEIYDRYADGLYLAAYNIVRDKQECEDLLQDLFADLWLKRETLLITTSLKGYLYVSIKNKILMRIRSKKTALSADALQFLADSAAADHHLLEKEVKNHLGKHIDELPEKCAQIFKLSREKELSHKEIASNLNISTKTVENQIGIALKKLRASSSELLVFLCILFH